MIISDIQHIESATEIEVQGGRGGGVTPTPWHGIYPELPGGSFHSLPCNAAGAEAGAQAFGANTRASTTTDTLVIQGQFSGSSSSSFAEAY